MSQPRLGQTSWARGVRKPIINAICRNENIPLKCVFEQVLEKTRREREHLWWGDAFKWRGTCPKGVYCIENTDPAGEPGRGRVLLFSKSEAVPGALLLLLFLSEQDEGKELEEFIVHA